MRKPYKFRTCPLQSTILETLKECGPLDDDQIAVRVERALDTVSRARAKMHGKGLIHIVDYRRTRISGPFRKIWAAGPGEDASPPQPKSCAKRVRDYQQRKKGPKALTLAAMLGC